MVRWLGLSYIGENGGQPRADPIRIVTLGIIVLVAVGIVSSVPVAAYTGPNLLTNPGCDTDDGSGSPPDGWTLISANVQCTDPASVGGRPAPDGSDAFIDYSGDDSDAIVQQEVDVTGRTEYKLGGEIGTSDNVDYARIEVEYFDGDGTRLDDGSITREVKPGTDTWQTFEESSVAPPEATSAVVRIILVDNGGTSYSDAFLNEVAFEQLGRAPDAKNVDGLSVDIDDTLVESVFDDHENGADDLGVPSAEIVKFGGKDLGGTLYPAGDLRTLAGGDLWVESDGSLELTGPTEAGTYTFNYYLENAEGKDNATVNITVTDTISPTANAGTNRTVDEDTSLSFDGSGSTDNVGVDSYEWMFGDGTTATAETPSHTYTDPGDYTVELTVTDSAGNSDTDTVSITVTDVTDPTADAGSDQTVDEDTSLTFDGSGSTDNGKITSYAWALGDGNTGTSETPSHTYGDPGDYTVELTVTDDAGNSNTDSVSVTVTDVTNPVADTGSDRTVDEDTTLNFDGSGSTDNDEISAYVWAFGDGNTATGETPSHTYVDPGDYIVELTVTDGTGNTDTDTTTVTVTDMTNPIADAGSNRTVDEDVSVDFNGSGSTDNVGVDSYEWAFGDGTTATGESPSHTYNGPGDYTVELTVTDSAGNTGTDTTTVTVGDVTNPVADVGSNRTVDEDVSVDFNGSESTDNVGVDSYEWAFGDGTTASGKTPNHTYTTPGDYTVELTVTDTAGNNDTDSAVISVQDMTDPTADAGSDRTVDEDTTLTFDGSGSTDNSEITSYAWAFGDGNTASGETPSHTYTDPGDYSVELTVTDDAGNSNTDSVSVTVVDVTNPVADAGPDRTVDEDTTLSFDGSGSTDNSKITSYEWAFGDGNTATGKTPSNTYNDPGGYTVELTVTDNAGNTDTNTLSVAVTDVTDPTANASNSSTAGVVGDPIEFDGTTSTDNGEITSYEWDFDDGTTDTGEAVSHTFADTGAYEVELRVVDRDGNTDTDTVPVTVDPAAIDTLTVPNTTGTAGITGTLTVTASDAFGNARTGEGITLTDTGGLGGLTPDRTNRTNETGQIAFTFTENSSGHYGVDFEAAADPTINTTANVTIERAAVDSISASLGDGSLTTGKSTTLTANATFINGTTLDRTEMATLTANDSAVATVDANGTVSATGPGETDLEAELGGENDTVSVSVSDPPSNDQSGSSGRSAPPQDDDAVDIQTNADSSVSATTTASANEPTSIDLGESVRDKESGTRYSRVDLTFGEDTEVTFSARSTSRDELPDGMPQLGDDGSGDSSADRGISSGSDRAISYVEFTTSSGGIDASDQVSSATISFDVSTERLAERGVAAEDIALHRYDDETGEWTELDTEVVSEGDDVVTYESTTPGFSVFAVGERTTPTEAVDATDEPTAPTETDDDTPGFGLVTVVVALLGMALLISRR